MKCKEITDMVAGFREAVVVAAGDYGVFLYQELAKTLPDTKVFISDNFKKAQGKKDNYTVYSVEEMITSHPEAIFLITSSFGKDMIHKQLLDAGISENHIRYAVTEEAIAYSERKKSLVKHTALDKIQFEVDIVGHCNLNCRSCNNFSCISGEEFIDVEDMERDFARMGDLFHGVCKHIYLIGGEPLLHPQMKKCMEIARKAFPKGDIYVFTNGLLLLQQEASFWETCRLYQISIIVTKYPIKLDYEAIEQKAKNEGVPFEFFGTSEDFSGMNNLGLDMEGTQDPLKSFINCSESNKCIKLSAGQLYTCPRPSAIHRFNAFFDKSLSVSEEDGIRIHEAASGEEILSKLAKPIPFCRYCKKDPDSRKTFPWSQTERDINEWL